MKIIAGLGNYGSEYDKTRHNVGFDTLDELAKRHGISVTGFERHALVGKGVINGVKVLLMKPQTYMNLSGVAIRAAADYYDCNTEDIIVISDDTALDCGRIRVRPKGSAGGHNGLKNIINELGTNEFTRVRIGVGEKPPEWDMVDWVLGRFPSELRPEADEGIKKAADAAEALLTETTEAVMNRFN